MCIRDRFYGLYEAAGFRDGLLYLATGNGLAHYQCQVSGLLGEPGDRCEGRNLAVYGTQGFQIDLCDVCGFTHIFFLLDLVGQLTQVANLFAVVQNLCSTIRMQEGLLVLYIFEINEQCLCLLYTSLDLTQAANRICQNIT